MLWHCWTLANKHDLLRAARTPQRRAPPGTEPELLSQALLFRRFGNAEFAPALTALTLRKSICVLTSTFW